jgi:hypothetical protein
MTQATRPTAPEDPTTPAGGGAPRAGPPDPRTRWIGIAIVGAAAVFAFVVTIGIFVPALGQLGAASADAGVDEPSQLPELILVCDREYARAASPVVLTQAELDTVGGPAPTVVSTLPDAGCPSGTCLEGGMCLAVVYLRMATDRYVAYELEDGP